MIEKLKTPNSMRASFSTSEDLIGKYINRHGYSDIDPVGKIVGIKSKTIVFVQPVVAGENKTKMEWVAGGFAGHCVNQHAQSYDFTEEGEVFEMRLSSGDKYHRISEKPIKYYDYNF
jgi:hypothetical protein